MSYCCAIQVLILDIIHKFNAFTIIYQIFSTSFFNKLSGKYRFDQRLSGAACYSIVIGAKWSGRWKSGEGISRQKTNRASTPVMHTLVSLCVVGEEGEEGGDTLRLGDFGGKAVGCHHCTVVLAVSLTQLCGHQHGVVEVGKRRVGI